MSAKPDIAGLAGKANTGNAPLRAISFGNPAVTVDRRDDGTIYLRPTTALGDYPPRITDRLHHWAKAEPHRVFMAARDGGRGWREITYEVFLDKTRAIPSRVLAGGGL